jgi:hypothetical protein
VRPCRQESQTWGQTTAMLRAAAKKPRAAIMVELGSVHVDVDGRGHRPVRWCTPSGNPRR